jgi:nitrogen regulatory protein P-II 1
VKKIEAIIRPEKVTSVILALEAAGDLGVTVYEVAGHGRQRGFARQGDQVELRPKIMLVTVVKNSEADKIVKTIMDTASTSKVGDGKIFVTDLHDAVRIRTKEYGEKAIS